MQYTLIKGKFHVVGYSPDGDSIMFKANDKGLWSKLSADNQDQFKTNLGKDGGVVQLRLEGIDALETHYAPETLQIPADLKAHPSIAALDQYVPKPKLKQPTDIGIQAADAFMHFLGVIDVEWKPIFNGHMVEKVSLVQGNGNKVSIKEKQADQIPGYIVTCEVEKNGRPLAWVFSGTPGEPDGTPLSKNQLAARVKQSANYHLLKQGLVYPYFFMNLAGGLRAELAKAVKSAQKAAAKLAAKPLADPAKASNVWLYDKTSLGLNKFTVKMIAEETVIFPYMFRKVVKSWYCQNVKEYWKSLQGNGTFKYLPQDANFNLEGLFKDGNPWVFVVSDQDFVRLDEVVYVKKDSLQMKKQPADIVFLS